MADGTTALPTDSNDHEQMGEKRPDNNLYFPKQNTNGTKPVEDAVLAAAIGTTADADSTSTVIGRLKQLVTTLQARLPAALTGGGGVKVGVVDALPAGTNAIGKLAANSGVDIGDVDVTSEPGAVADNSAFTAGTSIVKTAAGIYQAVVTAPTTGRAAAFRLSLRREVFVAHDMSILALTSSAPAPNDNRSVASDLTDKDGNAIASGFLAIRDTNAKRFVIPMAAWKRLSISAYTPTAFDQAITVQVFVGGDVNPWNHRSAILSFTLPAANRKFTIGEGAVGQGGNTGAATASANDDHYPLAALNAGWPFVTLVLTAAVTPTTGEINIIFARGRN